MQLVLHTSEIANATERGPRENVVARHHARE